MMIEFEKEYQELKNRLDQAGKILEQSNTDYAQKDNENTGVAIFNNQNKIPLTYLHKKELAKEHAKQALEQALRQAQSDLEEALEEARSDLVKFNSVKCELSGTSLEHATIPLLANMKDFKNEYKITQGRQVINYANNYLDDAKNIVKCCDKLLFHAKNFLKCGVSPNLTNNLNMDVKTRIIKNLQELIDIVENYNKMITEHKTAIGLTK